MFFCRNSDSMMNYQYYFIIAIVCFYLTICQSMSIIDTTNEYDHDDRQHRPRYHIVAPQGHWLNDPNGPFYDNNSDLYHLFYQYNPYDYNWGNMSWGHVVSKDMLTWTKLPVALYPDEMYDIEGVFSGSVYEDGTNKTPLIYYTCVDNYGHQHQCAAHLPIDESTSSKILMTEWIKNINNPIIENVPDGDPLQFRDPFVWNEISLKAVGIVVKLLAAASVEGEGVIPVYIKNDNKNIHVDDKKENKIEKEIEMEELWSYIGNLWHSSSSPNPLARVPMIECPDFFPVEENEYNSCDNSDKIFLLKYSLMEDRWDYYELGVYDTMSGQFIGNGVYNAIDTGIANDGMGAYYASKTFWDPKLKRRVLWGWSGETDKNAGHRHWQGVMALPRIVSYDSTKGNVYFKPWPELVTLHDKILAKSNIVLKSLAYNTPTFENLNVNNVQTDIQVNFFVKDLYHKIRSNSNSNIVDQIEFGVSIRSCQSEGIYTRVGYSVDIQNGTINTLLDTRRSSGTTYRVKQLHALPLSEWSQDDIQILMNTLNMRVFVDHSIIEVFFADGLEVSTVRVYTPESCGGMSLFIRAPGTKEIEMDASVLVYSMKSTQRVE
jgi:sucrose-6-phosphate hydrolase SacC (GH32 family)